MATADELKRKNNFGNAAAASTSPLVSQIPTGGTLPAPAGAPASGSELGRNVTNTLSALPGATGVISGLARGGGAIARFAASSPAVASSAPYLPPVAALGGLGMAAAPAQTTPVSIPTPSATSSVMAPPAAGPIQSMAAQIAPAQSPSGSVTPLGIAGVQKTVGADGRTLYSDGNAASDASLMARGPISARNMAAADGLVATSDAASAGRLRNEQFNQEVSAARAQNQAMNDRFNPLTRAQVATQTVRQGQQRLDNNSRQNDATQRTADARLGLDATTAGLDQRGKIQLLAAQDALAKATTTEQRTVAEDNLRALQGRYEKPLQNKFTVVPGGQTVDPASGAIIREPSMVLDNQTGQPINIAPPKAAPQVMEGSLSTVAGKTARFTNGKWVPQ